MIQDREFEDWREQWGSLAEPLPETPLIRVKIKRQDRRFMLDNVLEAVGLLFGPYLAFYVKEHEYLLGTGFSAGIVVFLFTAVAFRLWFQRGTWRAEAQSTRSFLELWRRRVIAKIRLLRASIYLALAWLACLAILGIANWGTLGATLKSDPATWIVPVVASVFVLPALFAWVAWLKRRRITELNEVTKILADLGGG